jgi:hypothetical protein
MTASGHPGWMGNHRLMARYLSCLAGEPPLSDPISPRLIGEPTSPRRFGPPVIVTQRSMAASTLAGSMSQLRKRRPVRSAAIKVVPDPNPHQGRSFSRQS